MNSGFKFGESLAAVLHVGLGYLKAKVIFFLINFVIMTICFFVFDVPFPPLVALGIAIVDILPVIGSSIVFVPWAIVCFVKGNATLGIQLAVLCIGLIVLEQVLEPFVLGKSVGVRPLVTFAASIIGLFVFGPTGLIVGPLIAAVLNAVYRVHMKKESGETPGAENGSASPSQKFEP